MTVTASSTHSILFVANGTGVEDPAIWKSFLNVGTQEVLKKGVLRISENAWMVCFCDNPSALAVLIYEADKHRIPYMVLPFADAPQWLPAGSVPASTLAHSARS